MSTSELSLLHAAERLFAQHGVAAVSLRQVNQEAGHKNMSAAHYHFGSREGLLRAVLEHRMPVIDRRRSELLSRPPTPGREHDLRFYLEAYVAPMAEQLQPKPEGNYYLRFLMQFRSLPIDRELLLPLAPTAFSMSDKIRELLPYLPHEILAERQINIMSMIIGTLANAEAGLSAGVVNLQQIAAVVANLIDAATAVMTAPISAETLRVLRGRPHP